MAVELRALYATLLVGNSPCHEFTKVTGHTGGFYHFVCRHGVSSFRPLPFVQTRCLGTVLGHGPLVHIHGAQDLFGDLIVHTESSSWLL